jgi:hypothetical protein
VFAGVGDSQMLKVPDSWRKNVRMRFELLGDGDEVIDQPNAGCTHPMMFYRSNEPRMDCGFHNAFQKDKLKKIAPNPASPYTIRCARIFIRSYSRVNSQYEYVDVYIFILSAYSFPAFLLAPLLFLFHSISYSSLTCSLSSSLDFSFPSTRLFYTLMTFCPHPFSSPLL